jgi:hypothetical protein
MVAVAASASLCRDGMGCVTGVDAGCRGVCFGSVKLLQMLACFACCSCDRQAVTSSTT